MDAGIHCSEDASLFWGGSLGKLKYFGLSICLSPKLARNSTGGSAR